MSLEFSGLNLWIVQAMNVPAFTSVSSTTIYIFLKKKKKKDPIWSNENFLGNFSLKSVHLWDTIR